MDTQSLVGQLFLLAREGNVPRLAALLDAHPDAVHAREAPHAWTLLHAAAQMGRLGIVNLVLARGLDVNTKERGDETTALHWAAAAGKVEVVQRLLDAGVDPVGAGDDHGLTAIGWATCWPNTDSPAHREIVRMLLDAGAPHTIFSAVGANDAAEVRRLVAHDPHVLEQRMSRHEDGRLPLHHAVTLNRAGMVALLLELGADPAATDDAGMSAMVYAADPNVDMETIRALARGHADLFTTLAAGDELGAERLLRADRATLDAGALAFHAKRRDAKAVRWLLDHGADPDARWSHWSANLTALHLAAMHGDEVLVRMLLDAGADPTIRDAVHDGDAAGWAEHHGHVALAALLRGAAGAG